MRSHALRLETAGLLARTSRFYGSGGALMYATSLGTQMTGVQAVALRNAPAPVTWDHHEASAEMAAYLTLRGREMIGARELLADERWVGELQWLEHGELRTRRHRPDLMATVAEGRTMAIEVELTAKSPARLKSVLSMYVQWLAGERADTLLYVVGGERERRQLLRQAGAAGLERGDRFGVQLRGEVQAQLIGSTQPPPNLAGNV